MSASNITSQLKPLVKKAIKKTLRMLPQSFKTKMIYALEGVTAPSKTQNMHEAINLQSTDGKQKNIIVFGVIDWHFRYQRPQQLAANFAAQGYNTFYVSSEIGFSLKPNFNLEKLSNNHVLYQLKLSIPNKISIYKAPPSKKTLLELRTALAKFLGHINFKEEVNIVIDHPFWYPLANLIPNTKIIYDCMDYHEGFSDQVYPFSKLEDEMIHRADLVVSTSAKLYDINQKLTTKNALIRNACEYKHFATTPQEIYQDELGRDILGYFGAIAEWFDVNLVREVAKAFPDKLILLIGNDTANVKNQLKDLANVKFTGEVSYQQIPYYLYAFTVAIIPFKVVPLTLATNPVKAYEYLAAGKPVVSIDLPELKDFDNLVHLATDASSFIASINLALTEAHNLKLCEARKSYAQQQTWQNRVKQFETALENIPAPLVSIIILTYNNLSFTKACLQSIEQNTDYSNYEVILVDNASTDDTPDYLKEYCASRPNYHLILNTINKGFAGGNNDGLKAAKGEYLVILNNDTFVSPGWLRTLVSHFIKNPSLGMLGPVTNNIGNEANIFLTYQTMDDMIEKSRTYIYNHMGDTLKLQVAALFCAIISRKAFEKVGLLDEAFGLGFFEDDDYSMRIKNTGFEVACAEDVFVHHHLSASFDKIGAERKKALFEKNKAIFEKKWGPWVPHKARRGFSLKRFLKQILLNNPSKP
ncbi:MAG: hypothetical protein K0S08_463 [Gammaproteobacteria bacterium]|jgi:GT2 family glycosyltransferase/glycosyltransferase involved in cell wall biosynthesis|nr:hypothetical protein [Gammaproteobacteria bacterium]